MHIKTLIVFYTFYVLDRLLPMTDRSKISLYIYISFGLVSIRKTDCAFCRNCTVPFSRLYITFYSKVVLVD